MNVAYEARQWFEDNGEDFAAVLLRCLFSGWVFGLPDFLLLAEEALAYPETGVLRMGGDGPKNAWFIWYLGHKRGAYTTYDAMAYAPYPHKYISYKRRGKVVVREWDKMRRDFNVRFQRNERMVI